MQSADKYHDSTTRFIGEIDRSGRKREERSGAPRFLTASGARLWPWIRERNQVIDATEFSPPLEERGGDRSRKVTPPQLSPVSLPLSYFSVCASRVGRWQCTGGLAPDTPYAVTLSQPRGILLCTSVRVTRAPSSPLLSSSPLASN